MSCLAVDTDEMLAFDGPVSPKLLREVAGHFVTGVCVITAEDPIVGPHGMTLNSLTTVSADPASLLICLNRESTTHKVVSRAERFVVNVLAAEQQEIAELFATRAADKFDRVSWIRSASGLPMLPGSLALLECVVTHMHDVHTHSVVVADVIAATAVGGEPLLFHRGRLAGPVRP